MKTIEKNFEAGRSILVCLLVILILWICFDMGTGYRKQVEKQKKIETIKNLN